MLWSCVPELMAWDWLHDPKIGGRLEAKEVKELAKQAGYKEDEAQRLANKRAWDRMQQQ